MKKALLLAIIGCWGVSAYAQEPGCQKMKSQLSALSLYNSPENLRSDTINILKYTINLDITDFTGKIIKGNTRIKFVPKVNGQNKIRLDFLKMTVDSIKKGTATLTYTYNDTLLKVNLSPSLNIGDTAEIIVYYKGVPQGDQSGWGGFYFNGNYAFNLGVGFAANPHNYGRVWFPCFDNFIEKCPYEFNITTDTTKFAYCNGQLISDVKAAGKRTRKWILNEEIPTYLASVAVADYTQVNWNVVSVNTNTVPIILAANKNDTNTVKAGFVNFKNCFAGYENYYGPYMWNRVGYCMVPFSSGAMEHATNIAYPQALLSLNFEYLMAHEFSHHWWGDLMTCETQEDMWLNEGFATYSEYLFYEWVYNKQKYKDAVKAAHDLLLHKAHVDETQYRAVSGIPHAYTYGDHVYKKGADVAHTLRSYMGDTAFFAGIKYVMQQKAYKSMHSLEFRDLLQTSSGKNMVPFFDNWVMAGGWPHFSIDSMKYVAAGGGSVTATAHLKQKLTGCTVYYTNVPLELTFFDSNWNKTVKKVVMSGPGQSFTMTLPFQPVYSAINYDAKISDAISADIKVVKTAGNFNLQYARALIMVTAAGSDSSFIRIEHNFTRPDAFKNNTGNYKLSTQRYWKLDGILKPGFVSKLRLSYDVNASFHLDTCLANPNADSLILVYRKNAADDWKPVKNFTQFKPSNKSGYITCDTLKLGEYAFANKQGPNTIGVKSIVSKAAQLKVYPNPATSQITIDADGYNFSAKEKIEIKNAEGKLIHSQSIRTNSLNIDCSSFAKGVYFVNLVSEGKIISQQKVVLQ